MFTSSVAEALSVIFAKTFQLYSITFPGTHVSIMGIFLSIIATAMIISLIKSFMSFGISVSGKSFKTDSNVRR